MDPGSPSEKWAWRRRLVAADDNNRRRLISNLAGGWASLRVMEGRADQVDIAGGPRRAGLTMTSGSSVLAATLIGDRRHDREGRQERNAPTGGGGDSTMISRPLV
jgi:hypothetical protein